MTTRRHYANQAPQQTLNVSITSGATSCVINGSFAGWPTQFPFFASLDYGTASAEIVSVTNVVGTTATIVRAQDGTAAVSHAAGATIDHVGVALDLDEANAHTSANTGVHGVSGSVVGTSDSQTLTNKTLASPTVTGTLAGANETLSGTLAVTGAVTHGSTVATTGAETAASFTANANGAVTGVLVPKSYTNEAAATAALPAPAVGTMVELSAPTTTGQVAGIYYWNGTAWTPGVFRPPIFLGTASTPPAAVTTATFTAAPIDTEVIDTHNAHDTVTNNSRYTAVVAGWYKVTGNCQWAANGTGRRITSIFVNGVEQAQSRVETTPNATAGSAAGSQATWIVQLNGTTDYVEVKGFQSSGGNLAMSLATLEIEWIRP